MSPLHDDAIPTKAIQDVESGVPPSLIESTMDFSSRDGDNRVWQLTARR